MGEHFTDHASIVRYFDALAAAAPIVRLRRYGDTNENRPLLQVLIARQDYLARLDEILARNRELANPATSEARAREIAATNPAVVYFSYGVHGNESSSSEAALWTAYRFRIRMKGQDFDGPVLHVMENAAGSSAAAALA